MTDRIWEYNDSMGAIDLEALTVVSKVYETSDYRNVSREIKLIFIKSGQTIHSNIEFSVDYGPQTELDLQAATDIVNDGISAARTSIIEAWKAYKNTRQTSMKQVLKEMWLMK